MTPAIEILWRQALKTFTGQSSPHFKLCPKNIETLLELMNKITAADLHMNDRLFEIVKQKRSSICIMDIFENNDISIVIFMLKKGIAMPLHDHPGMHGFLKVIHGQAQVTSLTVKPSSDSVKAIDEPLTAYKHRPEILTMNSPTCTLKPAEKNIHEVVCIEEPATFLDILSPPYCGDPGKGLRECTFFQITDSKEHTEAPDIIEEVKLSVLQTPPTMYSEAIKYSGPPLR